MKVPVELTRYLLYLIEVEEDEVRIIAEGGSIKLKDLRVVFHSLVLDAEVDARCGEEGTSFRFLVASIIRISTILLYFMHHKLDCSLRVPILMQIRLFLELFKENVLALIYTLSGSILSLLLSILSFYHFLIYNLIDYKSDLVKD